MPLLAADHTFEQRRCGLLQGNSGLEEISRDMFSKFNALMLALLLVLCSSWAIAQTAQSGTTTGTTCHYDAKQPLVRLSGTVSDPTNATVLGATVTLKCGNFRQDTHTTSDGTYSVSAPAGTYNVQVEAPGFETVNQSVTLAQGGHQQNFTLAVGRVASIVSVTETGGYVAVASTTSTKTDTPLIETPQSVSVVTLDQMASRSVQTINQAIAYTPGVGTNTYGQDTRYDYVNIRGFDQSTYGLFRDNSRWQSGQVSGQIDPYLIQEVDVIKGPSSVLYGQNTPGGLINLVTKRPPSETTNEISTTFGSYNRKQVQGDFGGPLGNSKQLRYRLTGLFRDSDTQVNFVPDNRWFVAPALTWTPGINTTFTILSDYQADDTGWGQFLPSQGTWAPNPNGRIDTSFFAGEPAYDYFHRKQWSVGTLFEHRFNKNITLRNTFRHSKIAYHGKDVFGAGLQADNRTLNRFAFGNMLNLDVDTTDTQLFTQFKTGGVEHSFLVGVDYSHSDSLIISGFAGAPSIDAYHPVYGVGTIPALFTYFNTAQPIDQTGLYFQDHIKIAKRFVATLSGREDWNKMTTDDRIGATKTEQTPNKFSGRVGFTYLSDFGLAPYFSYSTSFLPTAGSNQKTHLAYVPTEGKQYEAGVKFQPKRSNSFITASWFQITQSNVLTPDPDPLFPFNQVQNGEVRSRGVEFEGVASLLQGLNLHASYSLLDQEVTKTTDPTVLGKRPTLIPEQNFGVATDYMVSRGPLSGLGFGFGVRWVGTTAGDPQNTIILPSYGLMDLSARYLWKTTEFNLAITNLADNIYVPVCTSISYCNYGTRRSVIGSVRYRWNSWGMKH